MWRRFCILPRYRTASRQEKKRIPDEFCINCGYHRKYAIRLLNSSVKTRRKTPRKRGPKARYDAPQILQVIMDFWKRTNLPCSKRLKVILQLWLPFYPYYLPAHIEEKLHTISPATIDRLMSPMRKRASKIGLPTTKPGSILKKHIPINANQWDETRPGFLEADTLAHCGSSVAGSFIYTLNCVDIATGWHIQRAVWGKGQRGIISAIQSMEEALPFPIREFDCDNGSEFLNWHLLRHFSKRKQPIQFTRSRPYHKNDNAHIEEKNWSVIRQYLGYQRFDQPQLLPMLNDLYSTEWYDYFNFFIPSMKLVNKYRKEAQIKKLYDTPKTPYQRIMESHHIPEATQKALTAHFQQLNPIHLQEKMFKKIKQIIFIANKHPETIHPSNERNPSYEQQ
ncbi:MAG: transposase family protein [Calditrichaeota bacterium]|nr:transposase family protein [Calditrichota bacterium]